MAAFHEVRFPIAVAFGSLGGPERRTEIVVTGSGREERNGRWAHARRRFDVGYGVKSLEALAEVVAFFEERRGRLYGFRFRDPLDWASCGPGAMIAATDQRLGTGDGERRDFALRKRYGAGAAPYFRPIEKPVAGTIRIAVDGVEAPPAAFAIDTTTGIVTLEEAPADGASVEAGFAFDCPVRFDTDRLEISLSAFEAGVAPSIPIVEIRP
jgi:uncharacterized protein (TIGR02217 family)